MKNGRFRRITNYVALVMIILAVIAFVATLVIILAPNFQMEHFPLFRDSVSVLATIGLVVVTGIMAYATFQIVTNDREKDRKEKKERLLNEIKDWVLAIRDCSLEPMPMAEDPKTAMRTREINVMFRHARPLNEAPYIIGVADWLGGKDMREKVDEVHKAHVQRMFLEGLEIGMKKIEGAFRGEQLEWIKNIKKELDLLKPSEKQAEIQKSVETYSEGLSNAASELLRLISSSKRELLDS